MQQRPDAMSLARSQGRSRTGSPQRIEQNRYRPPVRFDLRDDKRTIISATALRMFRVVWLRSMQSAGVRATAFAVLETYFSLLPSNVKPLLSEQSHSAEEAVVAELERPDLAESRFDELAESVETLPFRNEALRSRLAGALLARLKERVERDQPAEWSALRCLAGLMPATDLDQLASFLDDDVPARTRQAVAQATSRILSSVPDSWMPQRLLARAHALASELSPRQGDAAEDALLISVLELLAAGGDEALGLAATNAAGSRDALFVRQLRGHFVDARRRLLVGDPSIPGARRRAQSLDQVLASLATYDP